MAYYSKMKLNGIELDILQLRLALSFSTNYNEQAEIKNKIDFLTDLLQKHKKPIKIRTDYSRKTKVERSEPDWFASIKQETKH